VLHNGEVEASLPVFAESRVWSFQSREESDLDFVRRIGWSAKTDGRDATRKCNSDDVVYAAFLPIRLSALSVLTLLD
jgi:hypothetical protein